MSSRRAREPGLILLPLIGESLLLPILAVAEVLPRGDLQPVVDAPEWLLGMRAWRGSARPVISVEALIGGYAHDLDPHHSVALVGSVQLEPAVPCYGVLLTDWPRAVSVADLEVQRCVSHPYVRAEVAGDGWSAIIPDMDQMDAVLAGASGSWRAV